MPGSSGMLALGMFNKDRDMKRVKKADGGMMIGPMPNEDVGPGNLVRPMPSRTPNAPAGRGYNREGFRGRGPMVARPDVTIMPVREVGRRPFKKGGMVSPKGNGCCAKNKPCKMS